MATLADLMIKIGADSTGLSQELNKSKEALNQTFSVSPVKAFSGSVDEVAGKISGLTSNLTKLAGIAAGGFGLVHELSAIGQCLRRLVNTCCEAAGHQKMKCSHCV